TTNRSFGTASFVRFSLNQRLALQGANARDKAIDFLNQYKSIYGMQSSENTLVFQEVKTDNYGLKHAIFKQNHQGIPVFDGELRFHFDSEEKLSSVNGNYLPNIELSPIPALSAVEANNLALETIRDQGINHSGTQLFIHSNRLYVFPKGLVQGYVSTYHLAYEVEVRNNMDVREFLYIDAQTGKLIEQFTGMAHVIDRELYENNTSNLTWQEGDAFPGTLDQWQQNEVVVSEHTYNFFNNAFGYVSYDNADATMKTVNNAPINCPNASWNGSTTNYCTGSAADDVVAHEWGHAYTQYTSGLIYAYQSGALNESYSDIWGETIDLLNNYEDADDDQSLRVLCNDTDRWRMGEDTVGFGGALRDMWNPTCDGDPGKVSDSQYWCGSGDSGGVHINSGVPNHAYALLVDGGTFNGETISAIGFTKAAHIFWRVQELYLMPSSNFIVFADALEAAAADLIGIDLEGLSTTAPVGPSGQIINAADGQEVLDAINAVELRVDVGGICPPLLVATDPLCDAATSGPIFSEDWESGIGSWTVEQLPVNVPTWSPRDWVLDTSLPDGRAGTGIFGVDPIIGNCSSDLENGIIRLQSPEIIIPDITIGTFELAFDHYIVTEGSWDGGNIKYSIDGGPWTLLPDAAFTANSYNSSLNTAGQGNDNPMAGEDAFTGADGGTGGGTWGTSIVDLSSLGVTANSKLELRWELGTDGCNGNDGWYLDEVRIYNCSAALSISDNKLINDLVTIYPNPAKDVFTLRKTGNINLKAADIYDLNGRLVKTLDLSNMQSKTQIGITELSSGVYFMKLASAEGQGVIKVLKD
ncbi:MAG: M4 family metallopeptidase, partial [Bacteroidia bacterium]|nr:M4 family metallopeptidase [Bacteroidia bacterium]